MWKIPVLMKATSQKRSTSTTIETDSVIRMILAQESSWRTFLTSSHLQVHLTSVRQS
jgi:hypothetical protein